MTAGIYTSGIPVTQANDWATEVGLVHPSERGQYQMMEQMKEIVKLVSEEELRGNMKKHNVAV